MKKQKRIERIVGIVLTIAVLTLLFSDLSGINLFSAPVAAQSVRQEAVQQVYQQLPDFPRENQYVNRETGKVDPNNTIVSRMIRYHQYVKGRPLIYRLDWKLTLADYLGINEPMIDSSYPGFDNLRKNPMESDQAVINRLNRQQRNDLVQALVNVFNPAATQPLSTRRPQVSPTIPAASPARPSPPQSGGARLLLP